MSSFFRKHGYFLALYGSLFVALLWPLLIFQKTFIFGDYWQQHYPWAYEYARLLKLGQLPYWVSGVAGGFPLVAEGQVGAYYLPHLVLYFFLPFSTAYSLLILLHTLLGGVGFYVYGQKSGLSKEAATLTALLFSFSSAFGGCFSNTASLKVLSWLPWCLLVWKILGSTSEKTKFLWISALGFMFAQMWTAGAPQMALYGMGYLFCFWMAEKQGKGFLSFVAAFALGMLLSLPQWASTMELVRVSTRVGETAGFVFWGSLELPAVISLAYPRWGTFLGVSFYLGQAVLLLLLVSLLSKKERLEKLHWWLAAFFFVLALGNNIPFLDGLLTTCVEKFSLTALRNPSKFLFFTTVSMAIIAGFAFDRLSQAASEARLTKRIKIGLGVLSAGVLAAPLLGQMVFKIFKKQLTDFANRGAESAFSGKRDPFHDISYYHAKADLMLAEAQKLFIYSDKWNILVIVLICLSFLGILLILKRGSSAHRRRAALLVVLWVDLLLYGLFIGNGFIGNVRTYPDALPEALISEIRQRQSSDHSALIGWPDENNQEALPANTNLLYSVHHAGGYSPLLVKRYYELTKELGISDSSLGRRPYSEAVWKNEIGVVQALGIGQILSNKEVTLPGARLLSLNHQKRLPSGLTLDHYLYSVEPIPPFAYAVYDWKSIADEKSRLAYLKSAEFLPFEQAVLESEPAQMLRHSDLQMSPARIHSKTNTEITLHIETLSDAVLVIRSVFYPRWKAEVDGEEARVMPVNQAFSGLFLRAGQHQVRFYYDEGPHRLYEMLSLGLALGLLLAHAIILWILRKK